MDAQVKREIVEALGGRKASRKVDKPLAVIELSSSDSESDDSSEDSGDFVAGKRPRVPRGACGSSRKKQRKLEVALPPGFLEPLPVETRLPMPAPEPVVLSTAPVVAQKRAVGSVGFESCKQFWKAGDYEGDSFADWEISSGGMDHVRVHPKFLHSNATSHKWALGAFAELLDNALDEVCSGATHANIDVLENKKDSSRMLLIEDNGGGMDPDKMRQCMSLGYSAKSKLANAIGQYGNGFKTSTMRLGADVIVFSRCSGQTGKGPTQSIGLLSYTFLRSTGKEDIVVPMLDYERAGSQWSKIQRSSAIDWNRNLETIVQWSPYFDEADLLQQFNVMKDHGTRIIIYNLWEDDEEQLELDFNADLHDIQIRGVNRDEKNIAMAKQYPNSKHFLTYKHSLRSYVSILYLRLPPSFRIILRGKDVEHHNIVNDMMMTQEVTYRPQPGADGVPKDSNMFAVVTMGFVKDAKYHIDVQGFNVYHKNRLIKPFWRLWNAAGSDGRGVIGVLEANFVEPAHDKQGFERTTVLARLEARLVQMQKTYWSSHCHKIGYAARRRKTMNESASRETSPDYVPETSSHPKKKSNASRSKTPLPYSDKFSHKQVGKGGERSPKAPGVGHANGHVSSKGEGGVHTSKFVQANSLEVSSPSVEDVDGEDMLPEEQANSSIHNKSIAKKSFGKDGSHSTLSSPRLENTEAPKDPAFWEKTAQTATESQPKGKDAHLDAANSSLCTVHQLEEENQSLRERLKRKKEEILGDVVCDLRYERDRCKSLESQLNEARNKIEEMNKEQESLIDIFSEERARRDAQENDLRKKLKDAANTVQELLDKVKLLEKMRSPTHKMGRK